VDRGLGDPGRDQQDDRRDDQAEGVVAEPGRKINDCRLWIQG
jgi:hypothetical protein